jgi:hypothetical protein
MMEDQEMPSLVAPPALMPASLPPSAPLASSLAKVDAWVAQIAQRDGGGIPMLIVLEEMTQMVYHLQGARIEFRQQRDRLRAMEIELGQQLERINKLRLWIKEQRKPGAAYHLNCAVGTQYLDLCRVLDGAQ